MAIAFGAIGTKAGTGTTTEAIAYPASVGAGDLLLACRSIWLGTATADNEAGWTAAGRLSGGTGTAVDDHTTVVAADWIEAAGGESGTVTFDQAGATGIMAVMLRYTKGAGTWGVAAETGDDATHGADRAVTLSSSHTVADGDFVVAVVAVDTNTTLAGVASPAFSGTATFGTVNRRTSGTGTSTGNDGNIEVWDAEVTGDGTCTGFSFTTSTSQCGPIDIVRLREVAGGATVEGVATAAFGGTFTAAGIPTTFGVAAAFLGGTFAALGIDRALGQALASLGFTATAAGVPDIQGVATASFGFTGTASGTIGSEPVTGVATAAFGFTATSSGTTTVVGAAVASFGYTGSAAGVDRALGVAAATFGHTGTAAGIDRALGVAAAAFGFTGTTSGQRRVLGVVSVSLGFTGTARGLNLSIVTPAERTIVVPAETRVIVVEPEGRVVVVTAENRMMEA